MPKRNQIKIDLTPTAIEQFKSAQKRLAKRWGCKGNQAVLKAVLMADAKAVFDSQQDNKIYNAILETQTDMKFLLENIV